MTEPQVTAILPTYRRPQLLARAIASVLAQTEPRLRVLVLDNASGDQTEDVVRGFARSDPRVVYHRHPDNLGLFGNFQAGLGMVETPFFSFLSDDDVLLPGFYQAALSAFERHPEAGFASFGVVHVRPSGEVDGLPLLQWEPGIYRPPEGLFTMARTRHPEWTATVFRREVLDAIGPLDPEAGYQFDLDFELRAAARFAFVIDPAPMALFAIRPPSEVGGGSHGFDKRWPAHRRTVERLAGDPALDPAARHAIVSILDGKFGATLPLDGLNYLYQNRRADAFAVASVLAGHYRRYPLAAALWAGWALSSAVAALTGDRLDARKVVRRFPTLRRAWRNRNARERAYQQRLADQGIVSEAFAPYLVLPP